MSYTNILRNVIKSLFDRLLLLLSRYSLFIYRLKLLKYISMGLNSGKYNSKYYKRIPF